MKKFTFLLALLIILGSFAGCGQNTENSEKSGDEKEKVQETQASEDEDTPYKESEAEKTQYPLTIKTFEQSVTFEKAPEKIGVFQYNAAEILAGLGLADKITALSGESDEKIWVAGGMGLANNILKTAGGENVFSDIDKQFASTTYEEVINRNPEVIVVVRNSGDEKGGEVSIEHLKNRPELSDVNAIKNNRFIVVTLNSIFPGIQNVYSLETIAKNLHPDAF